MLRKTILSPLASCADFRTEAGARETYLLIASKGAAAFSAVLKEVECEFLRACRTLALNPDSLVFSRVYFSDIHNRRDAFAASGLCGRLSRAASALVEQAPVEGGGLSLFAYLADCPGEKGSGEAFLIGRHYRMLWLAGLAGGKGTGSGPQMRAALKTATAAMRKRGMAWLPDAMRSWIFVRDIDLGYGPMVDSRRAFFLRHGLTRRSRFLASTGIGARFEDPASRVQMDLLCVGGLRPGQIRRMRAKHLMPDAASYRASFERGLRIDFGDRSHFHVSGTASIGPGGQVLYAGNESRQALRTLRNLKGLLASEGCSLSDLAYILVYIRDPASAPRIARTLRRRLPRRLPCLYLAADVCRPEWLLEIEGWAVKPARTGYPPFL